MNTYKTKNAVQALLSEYQNQLLNCKMPFTIFQMKIWLWKLIRIPRMKTVNRFKPYLHIQSIRDMPIVFIFENRGMKIWNVLKRRDVIRRQNIKTI